MKTIRLTAIKPTRILSALESDPSSLEEMSVDSANAKAANQTAPDIPII